jgi:hypothetical protein
MRRLPFLRWKFARAAAIFPPRRLLLAGTLILCAASLAMAGTLTGTVKNGTSNRPVPNTEIVLMELQSGMVPIASVKTDAQGRFSFTQPALGKEPMLLKTYYGGVPYYHSVSASDKSANVVVYEATANPKTISVTSRAIMLQPQDSILKVEEQYVVENQTKPPFTYFTPHGTFTFQVPQDATLGQVSTWTNDHIPTIQKTLDLPHHRHAIDWAIRPGKNVVVVTYTVPYTGSHATFTAESPYPASHVFLAVPPGVQVSSNGFSAVGSEEGFDVYSRELVAAQTPLAIEVAGTATADAGSSSADSGASSVASGASGASGASNAESIAVLPGRLHNLTWLIGIFVAGFLLIGTIMLWNRSSAKAEAASAAGEAGQGHASRPAAAKRSRPSPESVSQGVEQRLERIKDDLLQLELRHQAGTLSEEEYARERRRVDEMLRNLLRG